MKPNGKIGGTSGMHMEPSKHPFQSKFGNHTGVGKAKMVGVGAPPGGEGNFISANSAMKRKLGSMNGPGNAK